jgi:hypothetical protein
MLMARLLSQVLYTSCSEYFLCGHKLSEELTYQERKQNGWLELFQKSFKPTSLWKYSCTHWKHAHELKYINGALTGSMHYLKTSHAMKPCTATMQCKLWGSVSAAPKMYNSFICQVVSKGLPSTHLCLHALSVLLF